MKNIKLAISILCLALLAIHSQAWSQVQLNPQLFTKKWQVIFDKEVHLKHMPAAEKEAFERLSAAQQEASLNQLKMDAENTVFEFKLSPERIFRVYMAGEVLEEGTWKLQGKTIIATNQQGFQEHITLLEANNDKIKVDTEQYGREITLVPLEQ